MVGVALCGWACAWRCMVGATRTDGQIISFTCMRQASAAAKTTATDFGWRSLWFWLKPTGLATQRRESSRGREYHDHDDARRIVRNTAAPFLLRGGHYFAALLEWSRCARLPRCLSSYLRAHFAAFIVRGSSRRCACWLSRVSVLHRRRDWAGASGVRWPLRWIWVARIVPVLSGLFASG